MRWFETPNYNFTSMYKVSYAVSRFLVVISVSAIITMRLNYGIDFRGGQDFAFGFDQSVDVVELRSELTEPLQSSPEIKLFGSNREILLRVDTEENITRTRELLLSSFQEIYPGISVAVQKTDLVGPRLDRKSTRLNSSHVAISYAVFCLKKKKKKKKEIHQKIMTEQQIQ